MSRNIMPKASVTITEEERSFRNVQSGKLLFTCWKSRSCALLIRNGRLIEAAFSSGEAGKVGAVYIGKVKNVAHNIDACFVEIARGETCFLAMKNAGQPLLLNRSYDGRILEGDELLVQVIKDAQKTKRASVTAQFSLDNPYFVFSRIFLKLSFLHASSLMSFAASTKFLRLFSVSGVPLVFNPQSGFTHSFSLSILESMVWSAATISSTDGTLGE